MNSRVGCIILLLNAATNFAMQQNKMGNCRCSFIRCVGRLKYVDTQCALQACLINLPPHSHGYIQLQHVCHFAARRHHAAPRGCIIRPAATFVNCVCNTKITQRFRRLFALLSALLQLLLLMMLLLLLPIPLPILLLLLLLPPPLLLL